MTASNYTKLLLKDDNFDQIQPADSPQRPPSAEPMVSPSKRTTLEKPQTIANIQIEKIEGGLVVAGVVIAANCQIILPIFGFLFMLIGCVLTAASYRGCGAEEKPTHYAERIAFTGNSRILGPICIVAGCIMTCLAIILCLLTRAALKRQRRVAFHCPIHGDFLPMSPEVTRKVAEYKVYAGNTRKTFCDKIKQCFGMKSEKPFAPRCPRSVSPDDAAMECPPPQAFLIPTDKIIALSTAVGVPISPEQTFGSIHSLAVSREVASFPLSRTPSPLQTRKFNEDIKVNIDKEGEDNLAQDNPKVVECKLSTMNEVQKTTVVVQTEVLPGERNHVIIDK